MEKTATVFVDVILPLPIPGWYTYRLPKEYNSQVQVGQRAIVAFGPGNRRYTALIVSCHGQAPVAYEAKYVDELLDEFPIVNSSQLKLWEWIGNYYLAVPGDVMNAALPGALKLSGETKVLLREGYAAVKKELSDREYLVVEALEVGVSLSMSEIAEVLGIKGIQPYVKSLLEKKAVVVMEEVREKYKPKRLTYVQLSAKAREEKQLKQHFDDLSNAPKQLELLMTFLQLKAENEQASKVLKSTLMKRAGATSTTLNHLVKKAVFQYIEEEVGRIEPFDGVCLPVKKLNDAQGAALLEIEEQFEEKEVVLLKGVTSSGKTEVYIHLIEKAMAAGKQVLYLLPEIALTTQIIHRLQRHFGDRVGVYHSKFNQNERVEVWKHILEFETDKDNRFQLILGARSAIFLPFSNLGLIIVDEEHENTFKQYDPSPRYHARDTATVLAGIHHAKVLLGSATPSIESAWNAKSGKYGLVTMDKRYGGVMMPEIFCADIADDTKRKKMKGHFSPLLLEMMTEALENKEQIILFQNRRGYAPILLCETCGNAPHCVNCDVSLTYHKYSGKLICHYCNYAIALTNTCPSCQSTTLQLKGFGTEKLEEELAIYFPAARISRMDLDTTRSKNAYQNIIYDFEQGEVDVLVGTQMITKGLDFDNVAVVGVLNADNMLNFPDFRAFERSFQLMSQVAGRAGRKQKRGKVLIQAYNPNHAIIRNVVDYDYQSMYNSEIIERRNFHYPPFFRLISFTLRHKNQDQLNASVAVFGKLLKTHFGDRILGPHTPVISRIRNYYHRDFLLKVERTASLQEVKKKINTALQAFESNKQQRSTRIKVDVDPY
jgi:primosomal protein N' (replication factor Y)